MNKLILVLIAIFLITSTVFAQRGNGDDILAELEKNKLPGFGGMFIDGNGILNVYFVGGLAPPNYLDALKDYLRSGISPSPPPDEDIFKTMGINGVKILVGNYTFSQLVGWKNSLFGDPDVQKLGVNIADVDETKNLVSIGFEKLDEQKKGQVKERIISLGIPPEAIQIVEAEPVRPAAEPGVEPFPPPIGEPVAKSQNIIIIISAIIILLVIFFLGYKFYRKLKSSSS